MNTSKWLVAPVQFIVVALLSTCATAASMQGTVSSSAREPIAGGLVTVSVTDDEGNPVPGANVIFTCFFKDPQWGGAGGGGIMPWSLTNGRGEARCYGCGLGDQATIEVRALGYVPIQVDEAGGKESYAVTLQRNGAMIVGRVLREKKPLIGIPVKLLRSEKPSAGHVFDGEVATDSSGQFAFLNAVPGLLYWVFIPMSAGRSSGAFDARSIRAGRKGTTTNIGNLVAHRGRRIAGHVSLPRGVGLPSGVILRLWRTIGLEEVMTVDAWDKVAGAVDKTGYFHFDGVPEETMRIELYVPGFHIVPDALTHPLRYQPFDQTALIDVRRDWTDLRIPLAANPPASDEEYQSPP